MSAGTRQVPRILFVTTVEATVRAFLLPIAAHCRALGWEVDVLTNGAGTSDVLAAHFCTKWDIQWTRRPGDIFGAAKAFRRVRAVLRHARYDIVHAHTPVAAFILRAAVASLPRDRRPRVVYTAHGFHFYDGGSGLRNLIFRKLETLASRWTDFLVVINDEDERSARRLRLVASERVVRMPGIGVDTALYSPDRVSAEDVGRFRASLGLGPADRLITCVAELSRNKRHSDVIAALARLGDARVHLACVGVGPLAADIERLSASVGLRRQVHLLGWRDDIPVILRASASAVLVSAREGLPRAVMESLALEVPVIGSRVRGTTELVRDDAGMLVRVGDVDGLANAIRSLLNDEVRAAVLGRRGRDRMVAEYDIRNVIDLHDHLYREALGLSSTHPN